MVEFGIRPFFSPFSFFFFCFIGISKTVTRHRQQLLGGGGGGLYNTLIRQCVSCKLNWIFQSVQCVYNLNYYTVIAKHLYNIYFNNIIYASNVIFHVWHYSNFYNRYLFIKLEYDVFDFLRRVLEFGSNNWQFWQARVVLGSWQWFKR